MAVVSHVLPFPPTSGQHQRVRYFLELARRDFETVFVGIAPPRSLDESRAALEELVDEVRLLPTRSSTSAPVRVGIGLAARGYGALTGTKPSNFEVGVIELSPARVGRALAGRRVDIAVFHYWHAGAAASALGQRGIPTVLDMHNVLAWSRQAQLDNSRVPEPVRGWMTDRYARAEERAWNRFDALVAINAHESRHVRSRVSVPVFDCPMGVDLRAWPYRWRDPGRVRLACYGGLGGDRGRAETQSLARVVMPRIWQSNPEAELVIVGANPGPEVALLAADPRVEVTGFVDDPGAVLAGCSFAVIPFRGRYGFRSRVVEMMATGVPVLCTTDTVDGMGLGHDQGIMTAPDVPALAELASAIAGAADLAPNSELARSTAVERFGVEATYGNLFSDLRSWDRVRR